MRILDRCDDRLWWDVARRSPHATFFHTPLWHRLVERTMPWCSDVSVAAETGDGVRAVFPLFRCRRGVRPRSVTVVSTFAGCYGGPIADGPIGAEDRARLFHDVLRRHRGRATITANPRDGGRLPAELGTLRGDETHVLPLAVPFEDLFANFSKGHRSSTRKGRRIGVNTRLASTVEDYRRYYDVYRATLRRWGDRATSRYRWRLFRNGQRLARRHPDEIKLWLAELDGAVVAGAWVFYWNGHAAYWHGASDLRGRDSNAANVLLADVIRDARAKGLDTFDFGPSGGHGNVAAFKRRFGAAPVRFERWAGPLEPRVAS